jgi:hypothetical protein
VPFDTTYNFVSSDNTHTVTITLPGGDKDIVIWLTTNEAPIDLTNFREIAERSEKLSVLSPKPKTYFGIDPTLIVILITAIALLLSTFIGKYVSHFIQKIVYGEKKITYPQFIAILVTIISISLLLTGFYDLGLMILLIGFFIIGEFKNEVFYPDRVKNVDESISHENRTETAKAPLLRYEGRNLNFTDAEIDSALTKRFPYYVAINSTEKERFIHRIKNFIAAKIFFIHDESGFKEMPILISAAAIQLTFGLKKYLLPSFENIHVFPEEFFRSNNMGVCFLEGNVSGNNINLSWKHFLRGYRETGDGQNVGLHELAHALYYQTFVVGKNVDDNFKGSFGDFINYGDKAYHTEKTVAGGLYSDYAVKDFQEFWAESAEIFFERPAQMKEFYPELYEAMKTLLKQDLLNDPGSPVS